MGYIEPKDVYTDKLDQVEVIKLHDKVFVYKGLLPNSKELTTALAFGEANPEKSSIFNDWHPWGDFGYYIVNLYKDGDAARGERFSLETSLNEEVKEAFKISTEHWLRANGSKRGEDWVAHGPSYARYAPYDPSGDDSPLSSFAMQYHTDYDPLRAEEPGDKFILTCTMYLNDDYEGGEIAFRVKGTSGSETEEIVYKPEAGDVLVFPSGHPEYFSASETYVHGVKAVTSGTKYLVRAFYQHRYPGSDAWHENLQKYGAQAWFAMEEQRISQGRKTHEDTIYIAKCAY